MLTNTAKKGQICEWPNDYTDSGNGIVEIQNQHSMSAWLSTFASIVHDISHRVLY